MELAYLKTLLEVVDTGSFSKAADNLCVTQSAVSRRVKFMEDQYGFPLLDRSGPTLSLTDAGAVVADKAKKLLEIERELLEDLHLMNGTRRELSFCCTPAFGMAYLPQIMQRFMQMDDDMNGMKFMFDTPDNILKGLQEQRYDLAVLDHCACLDLGEFKTVDLPADDMVFVSSPNLHMPTPATPLEALLKQTLFSRKEGCCSRKFLDFNMAQQGRTTQEFSKIIILDDLHLIIQSVIAGNGVAFISEGVVANQLTAGLLVPHYVDGFQHQRCRKLVCASCYQQNNLAEMFVTAVSEICEELQKNT
jgi:DNA-binding transcriptional LysR family regulator